MQMDEAELAQAIDLPTADFNDQYDRACGKFVAIADFPEEKTRNFCPAGTWSENRLIPKGGKCTPCEAGQYSDRGKAECKPCIAGKFAEKPGSIECTACPENHYSNKGATACTSCPSGTISGEGSSSKSCVKPEVCEDLVKAIEPMKGDENRIEAILRTKALSDIRWPCEHTRVFGEKIKKLTHGTDCPEGKFSSDGKDYTLDNTGCTPCPVGHYQHSTGATSCKPCEVGWVAGTPGSGMCKLCELGHIATERGTKCQQCPANHYPSGNECKKCPAGKTSPAGSYGVYRCKSFLDSPFVLPIALTGAAVMGEWALNKLKKPAATQFKETQAPVKDKSNVIWIIAAVVCAVATLVGVIIWMRR